MSTRNLDSIHKRIEAIAPAMQPYYLSRLESLVSTRAGEDAWQKFLKRLEVAEHLSQRTHYSAPVRLRTGR